MRVLLPLEKQRQLQQERERQQQLLLQQQQAQQASHPPAAYDNDDPLDTALIAPLRPVAAGTEEEHGHVEPQGDGLIACHLPEEATDLKTKKRPRSPSSSHLDNVHKKPAPTMTAGPRPRGNDDPDHDWDHPHHHVVNSAYASLPSSQEEEQVPLENEPPPYENLDSSTVARGSSTEGSSHTDSLLPQDEDSFCRALKQQGLELVPQEGDGNCLFRAVALQVFGDAQQHAEVRERCLDFMQKDPAHFGQFVDCEESTFADYIRRKRRLGVHGNHAEIQALSELYNRPVHIYVPENGGARLLNIFHNSYATTDAPIRLAYVDNNHYNAVIDPLVPTAGLGLGFTDLKVGLADQRQVAAATVESDQMADVERAIQESARASQEDDVQRALKESCYSMDHLHQSKVMALSDLDATNFELEQAVLASSMESYRRQDQKQGAAPGSSNKRRRDQPSLPMESTSAVAAIPPAAAAAVPAAAAAPEPERPVEDYPETVQELVMNGFDAQKVIHAYDLVGDNFDHLLTFLMTNNNNAAGGR